MNWHEDSNDAALIDGDAPDLDAEPVVVTPLPRRNNDVYYLGDTGRLPLEGRRALCQLLIGPSIDQLRHPKLWPALIRSEAAIRSSLADLFLELVLDRDSGVAFTDRDAAAVPAPAAGRSRRPRQSRRGGRHRDGRSPGDL